MFARHDLAWLSAGGWDHVLAGAPPDAVAALAAWRARGWPAIVRRADADLALGEVSIGVALPPGAHGGRKVRIAGRVPCEEIRRRQPPLPLPYVAQAAGVPPRWREALQLLARRADEQALDLRVYGSAALQTLTGQAYLTDASDIDLLLRPSSRAGLAAGLALLRSHAGSLPLDGEIVFPGGRAVAWKEWSDAAGGARGTRVLVKDMTRVSLALPADLLASLEEEACTN